MIQKDKKYYVYQHRRLKDNTIFYIGMGHNGRSSSEKNRNRWWNNIVKKDKGFNVEIIKENLTKLQADELEKKVISEIGLGSLTNITSGGDGGDTLTNHPDREIIGDKIRKQIIGEDNPNYGKGYYYWWVKKYGKEKADQMKKEHIQKQVKRQTGKSLPKRNKTFEQQCREKWGKDFDRKWTEMRKKISDSKKEYWERRKRG
jgi:hypothetical protein